jgi:hypothetical protein
MKKTIAIILATVSLSAIAETKVVQNYPKEVITETYPVIAFGVKLPDQCTSFYNWATFEHRIEIKDGTPATYDRAACAKAWVAAIPSRAQPK